MNTGLSYINSVTELDVTRNAIPIQNSADRKKNITVMYPSTQCASLVNQSVQIMTMKISRKQQENALCQMMSLNLSDDDTRVHEFIVIVKHNLRPLVIETEFKYSDTPNVRL